MRYFTILLCLFLCSKSISSQEQRKLIKGEVTLNRLSINDVHIINLHTKKGTVSNNSGVFNIFVKLGERLLISRLNLKEINIVITKEQLKSLSLRVSLNEQVTILEAFTLERPRGIFDVDKDILIYAGPTVSAQTLKLPYSNTKGNADNAVFKIQSGAVLSLDNLASMLDGSKKRGEALRKRSKEETELRKIRKYFTDDFFITDLQIQQNNINSFLNFCVHKNIIQMFQKKNNLSLTIILLRESNFFPQKDAAQIKIALKKKE
jgi:hypothetical protein